MSHQPRPVVRHLAGTLTADNICCPAVVTLTYTREDPYALTADISVEGLNARWLFARELLAAGLHARCHAPAGAHRVFAWSDLLLLQPAFFLEIRRKGTYTFQLDQREVRAFLRAAYDIVPAGAEHLYVDIDRELNNVLA